MRSIFATSLLLLATALLSANAIAVAEEQAPPPAANTTSDETMWMFGKRDKLCLEWTDGCRGCLRFGPDDVSCSNIGIACQPAEIRCTSRTTEPAK